MANLPQPTPSGALLGVLVAAIVAYGSIQLDAHLGYEPEKPRVVQSAD